MKAGELNKKITEVHEELLFFGKGKKNSLYTEISKRTGISFSTVVRVLKKGGGLFPTKKVVYDECTLLLEERRRDLKAKQLEEELEENFVKL